MIPRIRARLGILYAIHYRKSNAVCLLSSSGSEEKPATLWALSEFKFIHSLKKNDICGIRWNVFTIFLRSNQMILIFKRFNRKCIRMITKDKKKWIKNCTTTDLHRSWIFVITRPTNHFQEVEVHEKYKTKKGCLINQRWEMHKYWLKTDQCRVPSRCCTAIWQKSEDGLMTVFELKIIIIKASRTRSK